MPRSPHIESPSDDACESPCSIERGMRVLGGKWTGSILWQLRGDPVRFNDLARRVSGASRKMIAQRLQHLESHGMVEREVLATTPVSVQYRITDHGRSALGLLDSLQRWNDDHETRNAD